MNEEGFILHLGHSQGPCPEARAESGSQNAKASAATAGQTVGEEVLLGAWRTDGKKSLIIVDISGVHQLQVGWCQCQGAPGADIQLLRNRLFPASVSNPSTAFTFGVLSYFHIDSVECKTSASSFFSKLRRLTNSSNPDSVPVGFLPLSFTLLNTHQFF